MNAPYECPHKMPTESPYGTHRPAPYRTVCSATRNLSVIHTFADGEEMRVRVIKTQPITLKWKPTTDVSAIRRAIAYGKFGLRGPYPCRLHKGEDDNCIHCHRGISKVICGDCDEVLPGCRCMRNSEFMQQGAA